MITLILTHDITLFTTKELIDAAKRIPLREAPGLDRILPKTAVMAIQAVPHLILEILNRFWMTQNFPRVWEEATVTVIPIAPLQMQLRH